MSFPPFNLRLSPPADDSCTTSFQNKLLNRVISVYLHSKKLFFTRYIASCIININVLYYIYIFSSFHRSIHAQTTIAGC